MHKFSRKDQIKFINCLVGVHDLKCECNKPAYHSFEILAKQLAPELTTEEKDHLKKCLGTTTTDAAVGDHGDDFGDDLETVFADDITEEETG
nr:MAG: hypothetical protein [Betatorquevirus sp.]